MKVVICSKNPVKIQAVKEAFSEFFTNLELKSIEMKNFEEVSKQPLTSKETQNSALSRIEIARGMIKADFYVSLEGGLDIDQFGAFLTWFVCIAKREGDISIAGGGRMAIPKIIYQELLDNQNKELGEIIDHIMGEENIKQKGGSTAIFTNNKIQRKDVFKRDTIIALVPFTSKIFKQIEASEKI